MNTNKMKVSAQLNIIWTVASKDIVDLVRNKLVLSLVIGLVFVLLMPRVLGLFIETPYTEIRVYDPAKSIFLAKLQENDQFRIVRTGSVEALKTAVGDMDQGLGTGLGLAVPVDFDRLAAAGEMVTLNGYVAWANRASADRFRMQFEETIGALLGGSGSLSIDIEIVYPDPENALLLSIASLSALVVILMMGLNLIPHLLLEEKQTGTLDALLVSPASKGQVIAGKALAGIFCILVAAVVVFAINWKGVVNWNLAFIFALTSGIFTVAIGLVLGMFFSRQQEITGLTMTILLVLIGAVFVRLMDLTVPGFVLAVLPWVPSVSLMELIQLVFVRDFGWTQVWLKLFRVVVVSLPLYILVVWKIKQADR